MIKFIDEEKVANDLVKNKSLINTDTLTKLRCYIKYLKNNKTSKKNIRNLVDELMLNNYDGFVMGDWDETLQSMVNKYSKFKNSSYRKANDEIFIYQSELDVISSIGDLSGFNDIEIEKVLFIMTILAKANGGEWVSYSSEDIFKLARFKYKTKTDIRKIQREKLIYDLANFKNNKILSVTNYGKHPSIKLLFIKEEGEVGLKIKLKDVENIIVEYLKWRRKEGYTYCEICGKGIRSITKPKKYCNKCQKIKQYEWERKSRK